MSDSEAPAAEQDAGTELKIAVVGVVAPNIDAVVTKYIALRDRKEELKKKFKADTEALDKALERCESFFLGEMNRLGLESLPTAAGVPYKTSKTSATVADGPMFRKWVIDNGSWEAIDLKANKTFIAAFKEEHEDLPPGINWREEIACNVRRK